MAGLKKGKRKQDTGSPNLVLVLFLIVFVLSSIILGLLLYFSYADRDKALADAATAKKAQGADRDAIEMYRTVADVYRNALGSKVEGDDLAKLKVGREKLTSGGFGKAADAKTIETYTKLIKDLDDTLDFQAATGEYATTYASKYKDEADKAERYLGSLKKAQADLAALQAQFKDLSDRQDKFFADIASRLDKEQKVVLRDANKQTDEMTKLIQVNATLNQTIVEQDQLRTKVEKQLKQKITDLQGALEAKGQGADGGGKSAEVREPHALLLDVSLGKPLWDDPVGTITRVDAKNKEVTINLGSARGVRPDLTFSVFAPSKYSATRAEKQMKGTIEVIRVLGANASRARITAQFDPDFPMHEGDLLFNMFWGTHVAVAGSPNVTGVPSESPSEQQRQLNDFLYMLSRQGMIVDAYLDLTDGQVKGAMTSNTRFLIRGDDLRIDAKELENKEPRAERALAVNNGAIGMRKDATEKGIFVISARNFATAIGYRPANAKEQVIFHPRLPTAGTVQPGLTGGVGNIGAPREAPTPMGEPKEKGDAKEKEKN